MIVVKRVIMVLGILAVMASTALGATPSVWYSMDDEGNIWREGVRVDTEVRDVEGSVFMWIQEDSAVWIFNPYNLEHAPAYLPIRNGERCTEVMQSRDGSLYVLGLSSENIAAYDMGGEQLIRTSGLLPAYWADDFRFVYTSCVPGRRRGIRQNGNTWRGVSVFEVFPEGQNGRPEVLITPVIPPDRKSDYEAVGVDDGECIVIRREGKSSEEIRVALPAAG